LAKKLGISANEAVWGRSNASHVAPDEAEASLRPRAAWAAVVDAIADRSEPSAEDFIYAIGAKPTLRSWEALAATSFWFKALEGRAPEAHAEMAERIAEALGATYILDARRVNQ